jgi:hypothetical protein
LHEAAAISLRQQMHLVELLPELAIRHPIPHLKQALLADIPHLQHITAIDVAMGRDDGLTRGNPQPYPSVDIPPA